jgi:tripartite-type tricarboxylate transporter receptor subunit TctC
MANQSRRNVLALLACTPFACFASRGFAQQHYPTKPVRFLVPQAPGGGADLLVRTIQNKLQAFFGQPVVVENKPGAGGNIGTAEGARSPPDGHTLVFVNMSTMAINPHIYKNPGYHVSDFAPVTNMASVTNLICVNPKVPAQSLGELIALARAKPGDISYATAGNGSENHLMGELLKSMAGFDMLHVPYKGGGPAVIAAVGGEVSAIVADPLSAISHVKSGKLRALAVTSGQRVKSFPDIPTVAEAGVAGYEANGWRGLVLPKGASKEVVAAVHKGVTSALGDPDIAAKLSEQLYQPVGNSPEEFEQYIRSENEKWSTLIKKINLQVD